MFEYINPAYLQNMTLRTHIIPSAYNVYMLFSFSTLRSLEVNYSTRQNEGVVNGVASSNLYPLETALEIHSVPALSSHRCSFVIFCSVQRVCSALKSQKVPLFEVCEAIEGSPKAPKSLLV